MSRDWKVFEWLVESVQASRIKKIVFTVIKSFMILENFIYSTVI